MYILSFCQKLISVSMQRRYRPELHYMRGPGPKWFEKHERSVHAKRRVGPRASSALVIRRRCTDQN
jgi:hypothetical protein